MLMVSGIGSAATLEAIGIPVLSDLRGVGQRLWVSKSPLILVDPGFNQLPIQDQPFYNVAFRVNVTTQSQLTSNSSFAALAMEEYLTNQTGPLADPGGTLVGPLL